MEDTKFLNNNDFADSGFFNKFVLAKKWGNEVYKKALKSSETITKVIWDQINMDNIKSIVSEVSVLRQFDDEQEQFVKDMEQKNQLLENNNRYDSCPVLIDTSDSALKSNYDHKVASGEFIAPWDPSVSGIDDPQLVNSLRDRILGLSLQPNNFLIEPSDQAQWAWTCPMAKEFVHQAQILLRLDPNLNLIRYKLVPSTISEDLFWCNYFYRLSLIYQSFKLSTLTDQTHPYNDENFNENDQELINLNNNNKINHITSNWDDVDTVDSNPNLNRKVIENVACSTEKTELKIENQNDGSQTFLLDKRSEEEIEREVEELVLFEMNKNSLNVFDLNDTESEVEEDPFLN